MRPCSGRIPVKVTADSVARRCSSALCAFLCPPGMASGLPAFRDTSGDTPRGRVFRFPAKRQESPGIFRLAGSARRRRLPCPPSPLSGRDRTALFPWNLSTAWKVPVGISTFHPRQTGTDTNKSTNKNGVVHVLPRFTPVHDRRTKKKKESPRRRLQTAGNFYGFLGQGRAVSVSAMAAPCSAISDSAIGKKRNVSLKMAPFQ